MNELQVALIVICIFSAIVSFIISTDYFLENKQYAGFVPYFTILMLTIAIVLGRLIH